MLRNTLLIALLTALTSPILADEIYKTVDEDGKVIYTDTPQKEAEKVEMQELNTLPPPEYRSRYEGPGGEGARPQALDYQLYLSAPEQGYQVGPQQSSLNIQVSLQPSLQDDHALQLYINGEAQGAPQTSTGFVATNLMRGQKSISVSVVDGKGRVLASTPAVTVYVIRPNPKAK